MTLQDGAREAGAEVRDGCVVEELVWNEGRVAGVRGRRRGGGAPATETARLVVCADGKHSMVADAVGARRYRQRPVATVACYTYWSGVPMAGGELYQRPGRAVAAFPTNNGLTMVLAMAPIAELEALRRDVEGHYLATLDRCRDLGDRVRHGQRAERIRVTPDMPNAVRGPHGPGWALVGDAGLVMDPITAQGISNALRDAEYLADAVTAAVSSGRPLETRLLTTGDGGIRPPCRYTTSRWLWPR